MTYVLAEEIAVVGIFLQVIRTHKRTDGHNVLSTRSAVRLMHADRRAVDKCYYRDMFSMLMVKGNECQIAHYAILVRVTSSWRTMEEHNVL